MPWREVSEMEERAEFIRLALREGANRRELCRRFGISPAVGYKWLARWQAGERDLSNRARRPCSSPLRTHIELERRIVSVRKAHPAWGARKIARWLERAGTPPPAVSTVHEILRRHGEIVPPAGGEHASLRFEKEAPNLLWQMDFKGWITLSDGVRCHPLTVVDDHSRFAVCLSACTDQQAVTVQQRLEGVFRRYGLPDAVFVDNGTPWGDSTGASWTRFGVWLLKLGVGIVHSRPYHPQSRGKNERFHRTLKDEVLAFRRFRDLNQLQRAFNRWRSIYNFERPHEAIGQNVPADRYRPSPRTMPVRLPQVEYGDGEIVRQVPASKAYVSFRGRLWKVPQAFQGERVAIRPLSRDGLYGVFFAAHQIASIDLTNPNCVSHVSEQVSAMSPD
jgi:putative transposase